MPRPRALSSKSVSQCSREADQRRPALIAAAYGVAPGSLDVVTVWAGDWRGDYGTGPKGHRAAAPSPPIRRESTPDCTLSKTERDSPMQVLARVRSMLSVAVVMATMGLGGCVAYPDAYDTGYGASGGHYAAPAYSPAYVSYGGGYSGGYAYQRPQPRGYSGWGYSGGGHGGYQADHGGYRGWQGGGYQGGGHQGGGHGGGRPQAVAAPPPQPQPQAQSWSHQGGRQDHAPRGDRGGYQGGPRNGGRQAGDDPGR